MINPLTIKQAIARIQPELDAYTLDIRAEGENLGTTMGDMITDLLHLADPDGNEKKASNVTERVVAYRRHFPGASDTLLAAMMISDIQELGRDCGIDVEWVMAQARGHYEYEIEFGID